MAKIAHDDSIRLEALYVGEGLRWAGEEAFDEKGFKLESHAEFFATERTEARRWCRGAWIQKVENRPRHHGAHALAMLAARIGMPALDAHAPSSGALLNRIGVGPPRHGPAKNVPKAWEGKKWLQVCFAASQQPHMRC